MEMARTDARTSRAMTMLGRVRYLQVKEKPRRSSQRDHVLVVGGQFANFDWRRLPVFGKQGLQSPHLRDVVDRDVRRGRMQVEVVLMIRLGRVERTSRIDPRHNRMAECVGGLKLRDIGPGDPFLLRTVDE